ncbi:alkaline phosphatase D family protein [Acuticoccus sediminis]|uniref:alkaline phosphatase D family protein n=1 Tax=Acuticoccus sediminis TaxID=2184697 RepID=UPI001CFCC9CE|nr:alkaline phosphatase D family protein [Acuticoccus sediminis]
MTTDLGQARPILYFRGHTEDRLRLHALLITHGRTPPGDITVADRAFAPALIYEFEGLSFWRYQFELPAGAPGYRFEGDDYAVVTELAGDLRLAFVSCNGKEHGDLDREPADRNAMWARLREQHEAAPFALLLQGGDQIYADEVTNGHPLTDTWPDDLEAEPRSDDLADLKRHLEHGFIERYLTVVRAPDAARLYAEVPTLSIWDDHDICDGWGSLPEDVTDGPVGAVLFEVARRMFLLFQLGLVESDIAAHLPDPTGANLGWRHRLPGVTLVAPDLRSQRRRDRIMGAEGWRLVTGTDPQGDHTIVVSSVPLLGPRLSLIERLLVMIPQMQKYEDDLRDQWQSHVHRDEWRRMLGEMKRLRASGAVTVVSGEIHLATRAEMRAPEGTIHQLVASGITHPPPGGAYASALGLLASFGEAPLPDSPIVLLPLPGHRRRYVAERNFLTLSRRDGRWQSQWHLEQSGPTAPMDL